jgi:hypothetical protein
MKSRLDGVSPHHLISVFSFQDVSFSSRPILVFLIDRATTTTPIKPQKIPKAMFTGSGTAVMSTLKLFSVDTEPPDSSAKNSVQLFALGSVPTNALLKVSAPLSGV